MMMKRTLLSIPFGLQSLLAAVQKPLGWKKFVEMHQFSDHLHNSHGGVLRNLAVTSTNLLMVQTNLPVHTNLQIV